MPLYEFICNACMTTFETLVFNAHEVIECPACESQDVRKKPSTFGMSGEGCSGACGGCSGCR